MSKRKTNGIAEKLTDLSVRIEAVQGAVHTAAQAVLHESESNGTTWKKTLGDLYGVLALAEQELDRINNELPISEVRS